MGKKRVSFQKRIARGDLSAALMMLPAVFMLSVMSIYPFFWLFRYICYDYNGFAAYFTGTRNFKRMLGDVTFWRSVLHTFEYAGLKLIFIIPLALLLAVLLNQELKGSSFFRGIYFMPTVISSAIYSLIFGFIFAVYNGVLNASLQRLGIIKAPVDWLGDPSIVMFSIIIVAVWGGFGNYMIYFISGMSSIPEEIYESSRIDGANGIQNFFAFGVDGVIVVAGGYIFQKAGFASADFLHVGADVAAGFDSHVSFQHAVDLVVDEYVANLAAGVYDGA